MPKDFVEAGYSETAVIGDATEVWISLSENYDWTILHSQVTRTIQQERYVYGQCQLGSLSIVQMHILEV